MTNCLVSVLTDPQYNF
ncbi:unnamed protein product, partial [Allacma fusca]